MTAKHWLAILLIAAAAWILIVRNLQAPSPETAQEPDAGPTGPAEPAPNPAYAKFSIEGREVALRDGIAKWKIPGNAAEMETKIVAKANGDIDGDGSPDAVVILADQPGGSGTFYYLSALLSKNSGRTNGVLLGDRISLESIAIQDSVVVVGVRKRSAGEPMAAIPTIPDLLRYGVKGNPPQLAAVN